MTLKTANRGTALALVGVAFGMVGLTVASVPLYRLFCAYTGFAGTTQRSEAAGRTAAGTVVVRFNADTDRKLPWGFAPAQRAMTVRLGEQNLAFYKAVNRSGKPVVGRATYNVTPFKAGAYFAKVACFCFEEQTLQPGQAVDMPVSFFVDPAIADDVDSADVREITLSYTFFLDEKESAALAAAPRPAVSEGG